jgi:DNA ligase 4
MKTTICTARMRAGRERVQTLILPVSVRAEIGTSTEIDFTQPDAVSRLRDMMSTADRQGWEGLVLKRNNERYLLPHGKLLQIKLKKDYIPGLADSADLVVIGGRRDPILVQAWGLGNLSWTIFHLVCRGQRWV